MAFDIVHRVGIDDSAVGQGFKRVEAAARSSGQRVGEAIERQTAGARKLSGALSSTIGIYTSMVGAIATVTAAFGGAIALSRRWTEEEAKRKKLFEEQARLANDVSGAMRAGDIGFRAGAGSRSAGLTSELDRINADANEQYEQAAKAFTAMRDALESRRDDERRRGFSTDEIDRRLQENFQTFDDRNNEILRLANLRRDAAQRRSSFDTMMQGRSADEGLYQSRNKEETAALLRASIESDTRLFAMRETLAATQDENEKSRILSVMERENERHRNVVENIRREFRLKREAAVEDARRAREAREREEQSARFTARQDADRLDAQILRAEGRTEEAQAIEIESRHRQRLQSIASNEKLTLTERITLLDRARRLFGLEQRALSQSDPGADGTTAIDRSMIGSRGAGGGNLSSVFGGGREPAQVEREKQTRLQTDQLSTLQSIARTIEMIRNAGAGLAVLG